MAATKLETLSEIFNQKFFRIPDYQRGYAWEEKQLKEFWNDLKNLKDDGSHYAGLITVEEVKEKDKKTERWSEDKWLFDKGLKAYYVIDGQQRLTTCIILIDSIIKFVSKNEINYTPKKELQSKFLYQEADSYKSYLFGYEKDNPSDEYFKTKILSQVSLSSDKVPEQTLYTHNLSYAKSFFERNLKEMIPEQIELLFKKIVNGLKFNFYEIDNDLDVFITFETMNNRGKTLSKLELLKNRLIYITTLINEPQDTKDRIRKDINEAWKTIYEYLGKNDKNNKLKDDDFLSDHWKMYFEYNRKVAKAYATFLLEEHFIPENVLNISSNNKITLKEIKEYVESISISVKKWCFIQNPELIKNEYSEMIKTALKRLNRCSYGAFVPLIIAAMVNQEKEEDIVNLLDNAEKFGFLIFKVSKRNSNTKDSHLYYKANELYKKSIKIGAVINDIHKLIYDGKDGYLDLEAFKKSIEESYKKRHEGYYNWDGLKYFLYEYETKLQKDSQGPLKIDWDEVNKREKADSIEHIFPRTATDAYWIDRFKQFDDDAKYRLLNSLGNLLLIPKPKNSSLKNASFDYKRKNVNNLDYVHGNYSEIKVAQDNTEWGAEQIKKRGLELLNYLESKWNIQFGNEEEKVRILGLDFLNNKTPTAVNSK